MTDDDAPDPDPPETDSEAVSAGNPKPAAAPDWKVQIAPKEEPAPTGLLLLVVLCVVAVGIYYAVTRPDVSPAAPSPPATVDGGGPLDLATVIKNDKQGRLPESTRPVPESRPAGAPTTKSRWDGKAKRYSFPEAGFTVEIPPVFALDRKKQGLNISVAFLLSGKKAPALSIVSGPAFPWMTPRVIQENMPGKWHEGGRVVLGSSGEVDFVAPTQSWLELTDGFVLVTPTRLMMFSTFEQGYGSPEVRHLLNSLKFLRILPVAARYQRHFKLSEAQATAMAGAELIEKMEADLKHLEAIRLPLPLPMASGIKAYKAGGMTALNLMMLRDVISPAVKAAKGHASVVVPPRPDAPPGHR